ncbi:MAG: N-acyl homoserine lactonase family protein [Candidatus Limnocylindria bacterium]
MKDRHRQADVARTVRANEVTSPTMEVIRGGSAQVLALRLSQFTYPDRHPLAGRPGVAYAFAIVRAQDVILYDTGIGFGDAWVDRTVGHRTSDLRQALSRADIDPSAVSAIVHSHLHFDHCGQSRSFPGVPLLVQGSERDAARRPDYTVPEWVDFAGARYELLDGDRDLGGGVSILFTPGHTVGHQSVLIEGEGGPTILAGHAIFSAAEFRGEVPAAETGAAGLASATRLRALEPRQVYFSHDEATWP